MKSKKVYHFTMQDFTVTQLLKYLKSNKVPDTAKLYNSCYYLAHTSELLEQGRIGELDSIFLLDHNTNTAVFDFVSKREPLTVKDLTDLPIKEAPLQRDVEDGYVYSNYDNITHNNEFVVLS